MHIKFGTLSSGVERRIESAPLEQLESWLEGILTAESVEELLGEDR